MKIFCIQQVFFEGPSIIKDWALAAGHEFVTVKLFENAVLPSIEKVDGLVVLGGPMSVHDEAELPWLKDEKQFIKQCLDANKPILGICLGAQLLADVLGAKVCKSEFKEIGWWPIEFNEKGKTLSVFENLPASFTTFQWHGDTFEIPENAVNLATSEGCKNQAFQYKSALALQFHPEMVVERIAELAEHCSHELKDGKYVQSKSDLLDKKYVAQNHNWLKTVLDRLFKT